MSTTASGMEHGSLHGQEKQLSFNKQQNVLEKIYKDGFSSYAGKIANLKEAFSTGDDCIYCMDEGTPRGIHSAGSGILMDKEKFILACKEFGVKGVTSHEGCGAAALYAKKHGLDPAKADEYGKKWAQEIAVELGVPYNHIKSSDMARPKDFHIARIAYYDGTGMFDYSKVAELPAGFTISRPLLGEEASLNEANIAFSIATGDHGYGSRINATSPFIVVVIGKNKENLESLKGELEELKVTLGDRVQIDGFVAPFE